MHHRKSSNEPYTSKFAMQNSGHTLSAEVKCKPRERVWRVNRPRECASSWALRDARLGRRFHSIPVKTLQLIATHDPNKFTDICYYSLCFRFTPTSSPQMSLSLGKTWEEATEIFLWSYFTPLHREKLWKSLRRVRKTGHCHHDVIDVYCYLKHFLVSYLLFKSYGKGSINRAKYLLTFMKHPHSSIF